MNRYINIGKITSLNNIGIENKDVVIDKIKLENIKKKHTSISNNIIELIPNILNNPTLILRSRSVMGRIVIFSNILDKYNKPIMIALELNTKYSNYRIASIYARDKISNLNNWINNESSILYIKEDNETYKLFDELNIKIPNINVKESIMIKDIPLNERPREKAIINGVEVLSNEELISIILKVVLKTILLKHFLIIKESIRSE